MGRRGGGNIDGDHKQAQAYTGSVTYVESTSTSSLRGREREREKRGREDEGGRVDGRQGGYFQEREEGGKEGG